MARKRIQFFRDEKGPYAKIYVDHTVKTIRDIDHLEKLASICEDKEASLEEDGTVHGRISSIIDEYERYIQRNKVKLIIYNLPKVPIALVKSYPKATAVIVAVALTITGAINLAKNRTTTDVPNLPPDLIETKGDMPTYPDDIIYDSSSIVYDTEEPEVTEDYEEGNTFSYSYNKEGDPVCVQNARRYEEYFVKYGNRYGVDPELLIAIAAQEGSGKHYENVGKGAAEGIMQIQKSVHIGETLRVYNYETNQYDTIYVTAEKLQDLESNIETGAAIWADYLRMYNGNIPLTLQAYNFGPGNIKKVLNACSEAEGISKEDIIADPTYNGWMNYRYVVTVGDPHYVENVFKFLPNDKEITVQTQNGPKSITIHKEPEKSNHM